MTSRDRPALRFVSGGDHEPRSGMLRTMLVIGADLGRSAKGVHLKAIWPKRLEVAELTAARDALLERVRGGTE
jgi:hypothetical protein